MLSAYPVSYTHLDVYKRQDLSDIVKDTEFSVFSSAIAAGGSVRAIVAKNAAGVLTRKEIDKLTEFSKGIGAKGLAYIRWHDDAPNCSFAKFLKEGELDAILSELGCEKGDVVLIVADKNKVTLPVLGALRLKVGKQIGIVPDSGYNFLWITAVSYTHLDVYKRQERDRVKHSVSDDDAEI